MTGIGITLQPDSVYLDLLDPAFAEVDYFEIAPETMWRFSEAQAELVPNGFARRFQEIIASSSAACVAHGVSLSLASPRDSERWQMWARRIAADLEVFSFQWYTDHLGFTALPEQNLLLPLPVPHCEPAVEIIRENLLALRAMVPQVGFENSVFYFQLADPMDDGEFFRRILVNDGDHLLLDLHNVYTLALNSGISAAAYIDRLPLERVIEIHIAGGTNSAAGWLPGNRTLRLDSHDQEVPEPVWKLLNAVGPRCANLRGVTLERMEGTVTAQDVDPIRRELERARKAMEGWR